MDSESLCGAMRSESGSPISLIMNILLGEQEKTEGFVGALSKQASGKSRNAGVEEKARKAFEESIGSTASYGDGVDWANVALYFLNAGNIEGI